MISNFWILFNLSVCEHYPLKKHFVGLWTAALIGSEKVMAPTLPFHDWSVWLGRKKRWCERVWEQHNERVKGSLIRTASNSWDRIWHAKSHSGMYDNGECVCVCVCFLCGSCVVLFTNGKKQGSSIHFTKTVFELSRIKPTSAIHLPPLFSLCPTYTITRPHTDVCTYASKSVCTLNTGLFVHSASPVCADGEQIWSTWVSELWSRKWFLPWFGDEPRSCHPVIRQTLLK